MLPALHLDRLQAAIGDQLIERRPALAGFKAKIVAQVALGSDAQGRGGMQHQALAGLGFVWQCQVEDRLGQDLFRYIVEPLEPAAPRHRHFTGGEQPFQRVLFFTPVPPRAGTLLPGGQAASAQRALFAHGGQYAGDHVLALAAEPRELAVDATAIGGMGHAPAQQG